MTYTQAKDRRIEERIDSELGIVREEVLNVITPVSIILFGGYGRGEGSAQVVDGQVVLSKDYDILLVVKKRIPPSLVYRMSENIHRRLGQTNPLDSVTMEMGSGVSLVQYTLNDLLYFRDAKSYEIKTTSKLIWGEDIRDKIPVRAEDLSPWNGIRFLLRKPPGLCASFSPGYLESPLEGGRKETLVHECHRVYLDGGVLLTVLVGMYRPTYRERVKVIKKSLAASLPGLLERIPDLIEKMEFITDFKLFPSEAKYSDVDPVKLWFETRRDLGIILRYFMEDHLGERGEGTADLFEQYTTLMNGRFVDELAYFYLKKRFKIANRPSARLANIAYQRLFCLKYMLKQYRKEGRLYLRALGTFPTFRVSTAGLMLLFSLNEDGTLDKDLFDSFIESLSRIYPVKIKGKTDEERWKEAVDCYIMADRIFLDTVYGWG